MKTVQLKINGKSVTLKFGYGLFRLLGELWNVPGINGVMQKFAVFEKMNGEDISFEQMDILSDFAYSAILLADPEVAKSIDKDSLADFFMENPSKVTEIMTAFIASIPQPKPQPDNVGKSKTAAQKKK